MNLLQEKLRSHSSSPVLGYNYQQVDYPVLHLSDSNSALTEVDFHNKAAFCTWIAAQYLPQPLGMGGYGENRSIYGKSSVFDGALEARTLHLGIDLWTEAQSEVFAPLPGVLHSFADNHASGDYGPTLILKHDLFGESFYTLYGHLSRASLQGKYVGQVVEAGERLGWLGDWHENVHWPPHLHFQLITDMLHFQGDFPGVCAPSEQAYWKSICPNPNWVLQAKSLPY